MNKFFADTFSDPIIMAVVSFQLLWMIYAIVQLAKLRSNIARQTINYYSFESIPSTFVTIGLFGTCLGIAVGLYKFDVNPENIKGSVQLLLRGLKSAFFVTILGLFFSLVFKNIINHYLNRFSDIQPPESPELEQLKEMNNNLQLLGHNISESFRSKFDVFLEDMKKTNEKLITNLDFFVANLADQNQQALIEALEGVVTELNTGFKEILGSLVKQNFQTLTESVNSLNKWQQQHKTQIETLTETFTEIVTNTQKLDETLANIIKKNDQLIGQNSKLSQIIDSLSKILVDDKRFVEIIDQLNNSTQNISEAAEGYNNNLTEIKKLSSSIDNWFKGEHSIRESIVMLQTQLNDLAEVKVNQIPVFTDSLKQTFGTLDKILAEYHKAIPRIVEKSFNDRNNNQ
jgi:chromosome segregation ATPase